MNDETRTQYVTREKILMLLSDGEVARVSNVEAKARPLDGEEYLDLQELDQGVRSALGTTTAPMGRVLHLPVATTYHVSSKSEAELPNA